MIDSAFKLSCEFLHKMLEQNPENEKLIDLYSRLLEFKSEYDIEALKERSEQE